MILVSVAMTENWWRCIKVRTWARRQSYDQNVKIRHYQL